MKRLTLIACIALLFAPVLFSQQGYIPKATAFDGTADHFQRGAGLTGASDNKLLTFAGWIRMDGDDSTTTTVFNIFGPSIEMQIVHKNNNSIQFIAGAELDVNSSINSLNTLNGWTHIMASFDLSDSGRRHIYVNDVSDLDTITTYVDGTIDWTTTDAFIGSNQAPGAFTTATFSEFYITNEYIELSIVANRRNFITADGKPVDLGPGCYKPTGTLALVCMQTQFNNFGKNSGTGGDFVPQDPVTDTAGPIPVELLPGRAVATRGRGGRGGRVR